MCNEKDNIDAKVANAKKGSIITDGKGHHILIDDNGNPVFIDADKKDSNFD